MRVLARWRTPPTPPAPAAPPPPLRRAAHVEHHWLTLLVAREGSPVAGARVAVRPHAADGRLLEVVARGTTGQDGTTVVHLPKGRYAVSAGHRGDAKCVTLVVERAGRATLNLQPTGDRAVVTVEALREGRPLVDAPVEARWPDGGLAARAFTDERGVAALLVPRGAVDVAAGGAKARLLVDGDKAIRLDA